MRTRRIGGLIANAQRQEICIRNKKHMAKPWSDLHSSHCKSFKPAEYLGHDPVDIFTPVTWPVWIMSLNHRCSTAGYKPNTGPRTQACLTALLIISYATVLGRHCLQCTPQRCLFCHGNSQTCRSISVLSPSLSLPLFYPLLQSASCI